MERHFLMVSLPTQGQINPVVHLGKRLARTAGAAVTLSTAISAHRRMFPGLDTPDQEVDDGLVSYIPYSDGYDHGFDKKGSIRDFLSQSKAVGSKSLSAIVRSLAERGRPVTCVIYTMAWPADVALDHGIPSVLYWVQPATVFAIYYQFFHGYHGVVAAQGHNPLFTINLPGLPPLRISDLPSLLTITDADDPSMPILKLIQEAFDVLDREKSTMKPRVLVNTFDELEADALAAVDEVKLIAVGPAIPSPSLDTELETQGTDLDLFKPDKKGYMEWLDSKPRKSVVYVSFGSLVVMEKEQMDEIRQGLNGSGRPYLWVVRKDNRSEAVEEEDAEKKGMVVEWCSQVRVLSHAAVGCFVTHCGWNSTLESLACRVPTVGVPQRADQMTNATLTEVWGTGVRAELNGEGVLEGAELRRCLEMVMGEGGRGEEMRMRAEMWREKAKVAVREGGPSDLNLRALVEEMAM